MSGSEVLICDAFPTVPGDKLLIVSYGIPEATDANGSLFGFERVGQMLRNTASNTDLIRSAQDFGQRDRATALSCRRISTTDRLPSGYV
jgi:hypothetical protein